MTKTEASRYTVRGKFVEQFNDSRVFLAGHKMEDGSIYIYPGQYQVKRNGAWVDSLVPASTKNKLRAKVAGVLGSTGSTAIA